uniref:hypothetical protein n=1 Tax=Bacillus pumilus TaxID=1408 RepID=UPI001C92E968
MEVYEGCGKKGGGGEKIGGCVKGNGMGNGEWRKVELEEEGIRVDGDLYLVYIERKNNRESAGVGSD